MIKLSRREKER